MGRMLGAQEVSQLLGVSESKSYQLIRQLNDELSKDGYITLRGKVNEAYLSKRIFGEPAVTHGQP